MDFEVVTIACSLEASIIETDTPMTPRSKQDLGCLRPGFAMIWGDITIAWTGDVQKGERTISGLWERGEDGRFAVFPIPPS
jgi:hypothetical protein